MNPVRGVILDVDGTLVDSNDAHARAWVEAFAEQSVTVPMERVRKLIGIGSDKLIPLAAGFSAQSPQGKAVSTRREEIFKTRYLAHLKPFLGARQMVERILEFHLDVVVGSSAKKEELSMLLRVCGVNDLLRDRVSSDDAERSKPDPDIVHAALRRLALPADEVLMLGDTPYDVKAAQRAGVGMIAFRCGGWPDAELAGAVAIYDGPADLLAHFESSPLGATIEWGGATPTGSIWRREFSRR